MRKMAHLCTCSLNLERRVALILAFIVLFCLGQASLVLASDEDFTIVVFPDTQYIVSSGSEKWRSMCRWVVDNKIQLDIRAVLSVGDITDTGSDRDFKFASVGFSDIENVGIPCVPIVGNHDYDFTPSNRAVTKFDASFGPMRFVDKPWYGRNMNESNANYYITISIGKRKMMILALEFFPRDDSIAWASSVIDANAEAEVIVLTHGFLNYDGTRTKDSDSYGPAYYSLKNSNSGDNLWNNLIKKKPNIRAVICGHQINGPHTAYSRAVGDNGNTVYQLFMNYQYTYDAWLGILSFHTLQRQLEVAYYRTAGGSGPGYDPESPKYSVAWEPMITTADQEVPVK